jgi:ABC-type sugar transport system, permease component
MKKSLWSKIKIGKLSALILAVIWLGVAVVPFVFMAITSFKQSSELFKSGTFALPESFYLKNYVKVLSGNFANYFLNSVIVMFVSVIGIMIVASMSGYIFARLTTKVTQKLYGIVVACMSIPVHVAFIPIFILTKKMGTYDSIWGLVGPYIAFYLPISVFILTGFMKGIPKEMEEAAIIDGCSLYQTFYRIIVPLSKSGLTTIAIYDSVYIWNEFSFALILTQSPASRTLPLAIWDFKGEFSTDIPMVLTVLTLSAIPMIIAFCIGQDKLVKGMMAGAVKG